MTISRAHEIFVDFVPAILSDPITTMYSLQPATLDDATAIARIFDKSFENDHIVGYFYPDTPKHVLLDYNANFFRRLIGQGDIYGDRFTKVVEETSGNIVGFSSWQYPYHLTPDQEIQKTKVDEERAKEPNPPGAADGLIEDFFNYLRTGRKKWINPSQTYFVHILAILPDHQRKGLASRLLKIGLDDADRAGAQTYIEASPAGLPLYLKYGWRIVDGMHIDMRPYGAKGVEYMPFLVREPQPPNQ